MSEPYPIDAAILAKQINEHARAMDADGLLLGKNLLKVAQHIDELIPEGSILVDRARFERLRALAEKAHGLWDGKGAAIDDFWDQMSRMEPGDRDPLP